MRVRLRRGTPPEHEVTGYAVALDTDRDAAGELIWFSGGQLAPDSTLPKLRRRWPAGPGPGPAPARPGPRTAGPGPGGAARLHGHGMDNRAARAALRREVAPVRRRGPLGTGVLRRAGTQQAC